ncbi:MAG: hypothetical protein WBY53_16540 [Acidobacteriaceae bacterium]
MHKAWWVLGVGVLSLPLLFVSWLMLASRWSKMDAATMQMPDVVRQSVAQLALQKAAWGNDGLLQIQRVLRLDPQNASAWGRRCTEDQTKNDAKADVGACLTAVSLVPSKRNWDELGQAQERAGDECEAENSFTRASANSSADEYFHVESMGRAALRCGDLYGARAGLETAIDLEDKSMKETDRDQDDIDDAKADQVGDREYLIVALDRLHETKLSKDACSAARPGWSGCACTLDAKGKVSCAEAKDSGR